MNNNSVNMSSRSVPRNLGFRIPPGITIECVGPPTIPDIFIPEISMREDEDEGDDNEPYFNPLTYCAITMDVDDNLNRNSASEEKVDVSRTNKKLKISHSNENSSFVCNGFDTQNDEAVVKTKKRHACHLCPKTFGWTTDLKRHLLIHTGERPFKCTMCRATFTRNFLLQKHKTKIHQCLSPNEISQLNNNVAQNVLEIKQKMRELESTKTYSSKHFDELERK